MDVSLNASQGVALWQGSRRSLGVSNMAALKASHSQLALIFIPQWFFDQTDCGRRQKSPKCISKCETLLPVILSPGCTLQPSPPRKLKMALGGGDFYEPDQMTLLVKLTVFDFL